MRKILKIAALFAVALPDPVYSQQSHQYFPIAIPTRAEGLLKRNLAADLYTSDTTVPKPVIFVQTPYNKNPYRTAVFSSRGDGISLPFDSVHYNYVIMDWRGFNASAPADIDGYDRGLDGYDAVEWIASQKWCDGKVGTFGASALGLIQFQTAKYQPPHLVCAAPYVRDYRMSYDNYYYGGDYRKEQVETMERLKFISSQTVLAHPRYDVFWQSVEFASDHPEKIAVPVFMVGGWFDHFPDDVMRAFHDLREKSDVSVRDKHKFVVGPWLHSGLGALQQGDLEFPDAVGYPDSLVRIFFDYYLREIPNSYDRIPVMQYYQMGEEEWRTTDDWSMVAAKEKTLYLSAGRTLTPAIPASETDADSFTYDPRDPSPAVGGSRFNPFIPGLPDGPRDIAPDSVGIMNRNDVVSFATPTLAEPLIIDGMVNVKLFVSSDRQDTDFAIRLCDVYPDGRSIIMTQGIRRMRFRNSLTFDTLMVPGEVYPVEIGLQNIALTLMPGHKLQIVVTSSIYPHFDRNPNNGDSLYVQGDTLIAHNKIYFNRSYPSYLTWQTPNVTALRFQKIGMTGHFGLEQNFPNPFNPSTEITFTLPSKKYVTLAIFDALGRKVVTLVDGEFAAGRYSRRWDAAGFASGIYFYRMQAGGFSSTRKLVLVR